jgi:Flp pilus assembly protein TadG
MESTLMSTLAPITFRRLKLFKHGLVKRALNRLVHETDGAEIAEAAAVLPLMFTIILGIFWFGQAFQIYGTITRAAQDGARAAAAPYCTTCTPTNPAATNAFNAVQSALQAAHLDPAKIALPKNPPALVDCVTQSAVSCTNKNGVCVQTNVWFSSPASNTPVCGVSVSFQYPFQSVLPFTSLNRKTLQLQAVGQVRLENQ